MRGALELGDTRANEQKFVLVEPRGQTCETFASLSYAKLPKSAKMSGHGMHSQVIAANQTPIPRSDARKFAKFVRENKYCIN